MKSNKNTFQRKTNQLLILFRYLQLIIIFETFTSRFLKKETIIDILKLQYYCYFFRFSTSQRSFQTFRAFYIFLFWSGARWWRSHCWTKSFFITSATFFEFFFRRNKFFFDSEVNPNKARYENSVSSKDCFGPKSGPKRGQSGPRLGPTCAAAALRFSGTPTTFQISKKVQIGKT